MSEGLLGARHGPFARLVAGDRPHQHELIGGRAVEGQGAVDHEPGSQCCFVIAEAVGCLEGVVEPVEPPAEQSVDDAGLRGEVVVDAHGGDLGGGAEMANRECTGTLVFEEQCSRLENVLLDVG